LSTPHYQYYLHLLFNVIVKLSTLHLVVRVYTAMRLIYVQNPTEGPRII
jgi:hypothetical protein